MRRLLIAFVLLALLGAAGFLGFHFWRGSTLDTFPPGALDNYWPQDTAATVTLQLQQLREADVLKTPLGKVLCQSLMKEDLGLPFALLNVDPATDVDEVRLAFSKGDTARPLALIRGRFDRSRFKLGAGQLEELKQDGFRLYQYRDGDRVLILALAGKTVLVCLDKQRVLTALRHARKGETPKLDDERLRGLLDKVERTRAIWFTANLTTLGRPSELLFAAQVRPIFDRADAVRGGIDWTTSLQTEVEFYSPTEVKAERLESHLKEVSTSVGLFLPFVHEEYEKVFLQLFANAHITRRGTDVTLRSLLQLE